MLIHEQAAEDEQAEMKMENPAQENVLYGKQTKIPQYRKKMVCHHRGMAGHIKRICWELVGKPKQTRGDGGGKNRREHKGSTNYLLMATTSLMSPEDWCVHSGAS